MINCIVIDDEQHAIDVLKHYIGQSSTLHLAGSFTDPLQALQFLGREKIDLIFLDIHMPQLSGMDFIRAIDNRYKIILCTAYPGYAAEGFDLEVTDYLVKPIPFPRFLKAIQKVQEGFSINQQVPGNTELDFILVKTGVKGKMLKINVADILYIEGMKNYVAVHHGTQKTIALISMKELEEKLPAASFVRIHKSFIVSLQKIRYIEGNCIYLENCTEPVLIGESYRQKFLELMKNNLLGRQ